MTLVVFALDMERCLRTRVAAVMLAGVIAGCGSAGSRELDRSTPTSKREDANSKPPLSPTAATTLATEAYLWGYPLVTSARTFHKLESVIGVNTLFWQERLSDVSTRVIVAPNQDTLYSVAVLDLRDGPLLLTVPDVHDRYWTYQMLDSWTEAFAYIGTRATRGNGGSFLLTTSTWHGTVPPGVTRVTSQTPQMFLLGRFLIASDADIPAVMAIRAKVSLVPLNTETSRVHDVPSRDISQTPIAELGTAYFDELNAALEINPPTRTEEVARLQQFAAIGVGSRGVARPSISNAELEGALSKAPAAGEERLKRFQRARIRSGHGWMIDLEGGRYRNNTVRRAFVSKVGWGENRPEEAVYP
ncbi:MAG: DUF1254 domain-containing protein, partial [Acidimicrobiia bacterium]